MVNPKAYQAIVEKIILKGKHGPYVVTRVEELGAVTFALHQDVWNEETTPEPGTYVLLTGLIKKRAGWRAQHGRFVRPSDQQPATAKRKRDENSNSEDRGD